MARKRKRLLRIEDTVSAFLVRAFEIDIEVHLLSELIEVIDFVRGRVIEKPKNFHIPLIISREVIIVL